MTSPPRAATKPADALVLVVGDANADVAGAVAAFPREGDDAALAGLAWGSGGTAVNVATALTLLGGRTRLGARVGTDPAAEVALAAARRAGVLLDHVERDAALPTGLCFTVISPGGERTFFSARGANVAFAPARPASLLGDASWIHVGGHALLEGPQRAATLALIAEARVRRVPVSLDLCLPLVGAGAAGVLRLAEAMDIVFGNERELAALGGAVAADVCDGVTTEVRDGVTTLLAAGAPLVVAKLGARGAVVATAAARRPVPGFAVEVRDTTACGDAFVAGFLHAFRSGAARDPIARAERAARLGNALGALTATRPGAADALPTLDALGALAPDLVPAPPPRTDDPSGPLRSRS